MDFTCVVCGKEYKTLQPRKLTCSLECKRKRKQSNRPRKEYSRQCQVCGTWFITTHVTKKSCSVECSLLRTRKADTARHMARHHALKGKEQVEKQTAPELFRRNTERGLKAYLKDNHHYAADLMRHLVSAGNTDGLCRMWRVIIGMARDSKDEKFFTDDYMGGYIYRLTHG
jgi:hypothetical protein